MEPSNKNLFSMYEPGLRTCHFGLNHHTIDDVKKSCRNYISEMLKIMEISPGQRTHRSAFLNSTLNGISELSDQRSEFFRSFIENTIDLSGTKVGCFVTELLAVHNPAEELINLLKHLDAVKKTLLHGHGHV